MKVMLTKEEALKKAIIESLFSHPTREVQDIINNLTGLVIESVEKLRGDDVEFSDAVHPDVHNILVEGVEKAVDMLVLNWDGFQ
jgi:hypothetical protein